ncbi:MAG: hypothetical protein JXR73_20820 [Candidatus Omnitrophica bacterium]|nr:hypothetical protein [Candidatus Omnitrophota bacterium]
MSTEKANDGGLASRKVLIAALCLLFALNVDQYIRIISLSRQSLDSINAASMVYSTQMDNNSMLNRFESRLNELENQIQKSPNNIESSLMSTSNDIRRIEREINALKTDVQSLRLFRK